MESFIAILRGINVGGHNKIKMADLRSAMEKAGFEDVTTFIQSGNIIFNKKATDEKELDRQVETLIANRFWPQRARHHPQQCRPQTYPRT